MPSYGYIQVHAYAGSAQIPLKDVAVTVTAEDGTAIAMGLTDRSGMIPKIQIPTPEKSESQSPNPPEIPFTSVNIHARLQGYMQITANTVQVFANTVTRQNLEMIPLSELPESWRQSEFFDTPPQNL